MLFACGGLFWILVGLHIYLSGRSNPLNHALPFESILLLAGAAIFANPHTSATWLRLYKNRETRNKLWLHSYLSLFLFIPLMGWSISNTLVLALLIRLYASLTFDHTISQNYGVTLMYCYRGGYRLKDFEKICLKVMHHSLTWYAILRQFTYIEFCPKSHLGFKIPLLGPIPEQFCLTALAVLVLSSCIFIYCICARAIKNGEYIPVPALFLIITSIVMFTAGLELSGAFFLFTPSFFHAAQYLVITSYYNLKETGSASGMAPEEMNKLIFSPANIKYYFFLFFLGLGVFALIPLSISIFGVPFANAWAAIFICGGFHHFLADSALWRLRDAKVRANLIS